MAQRAKNPPAVWNTWVRSLGWEDPLEEGMATHSSILAWRIAMDRGAWRAAVHGVAKNRTWLSDSTHTSTHLLITELLCYLFSHQGGLLGPPCLSSVTAPNPHQTMSFSSSMVFSWPYYLAYWSFLASLHYDVPWGNTAEVCLQCLLSPKWVLSKYLLTKSLPLLKLAFS